MPPKRTSKNKEGPLRKRTKKDEEAASATEVLPPIEKAKTSESSLGATWKECPSKTAKKRKYSVDEKTPNIATSTGNGCTIIGNAHLPQNKVSSWHIKILKSMNNTGKGIYIGVAPSDIDQNIDYVYIKCGWYFYCLSSTLCSGPPHNYKGKEYGPRKKNREYVNTGDSVGVVMDTTKGELSFVVGGVNLGIAYEGIPLDKPLVPCAILGYKDDSIELDTSEVKEKVNSSIHVPSNIATKSITWDTITLSWDAVEGASFYQIEVDGSKSWDASTTNAFTKMGFHPETEHSFRVRTVCGSEVSEWSDVVKGKTLKIPEFSECEWNKCPSEATGKESYSVNEANPRVVTKIDKTISTCAITGNAHIPLSRVTSWSIKILKSKYNDGNSIKIGVTSFDVDRPACKVYVMPCGWYFDCNSSTLWSGPPHNYNGKEYGPRKGNGHYVQTGDSVGVVMDTTKGGLSFIVDGVNLGIAFDGIPLDKPLVPCVALTWKGDSAEFII